MSAPSRSRPPRLPPAAPQEPGLRLRTRTRLLRHPGCVAGYLEGHAVRRIYGANLPRIAAGVVVGDAAPAVDMWSFSSQRDLPEQVASIISFLRHGGRPRTWTVASDGSHDEAARALLAGIDPCVRVLDWRDVAAGAPDAVLRFAAAHPLGKKLAVMSSLPVDGTAMVVDSDVLFDVGASRLDEDLRAAGAAPRYQLDCYDVLHDAVVRDDQRDDPTNTGVVVLHEQLRWDAGLAALDAALGGSGAAAAGAWLEQGVVHLAMRDSGAVPLDPERYVIRGDDYLVYREAPRPADTVLRHYAGPTRYMMWCRIAHERLGVAR